MKFKVKDPKQDLVYLRVKTTECNRSFMVNCSADLHKSKLPFMNFDYGKLTVLKVASNSLTLPHQISSINLMNDKV